MLRLYERLAGASALVGLLALVAGLAAVRRQAQAGQKRIAGCGTPACTTGKTSDTPPCSAGGGTCPVAADAPPGQLCGCVYGAAKDSAGEIVGCFFGCVGGAPK